MTITDADGNAIDLNGKTVKLVVYALGSTTKLWQVSCSVSGTSHNIVEISDIDTNTGTAGTFRYAIWNTTDDVLVGKGTLVIEPEVAAT